VVQSDTNRQEVVTELSEEESIKQAKNKKIAKGVVLGLGAAILLVLGAVVVAFIVVVVLFLKLIFSLGSARSKRQKNKHK
jgi:hypothetical protein